MTKFSGWKIKGESMNAEKACLEFNIGIDIILNGIKSGMLEFREGVIKGKPFLRILRSQLLKYIEQQGGAYHLRRIQAQLILRDNAKSITCLEKSLADFKSLKARIEIFLS